ncbi:hypothetical protein QUF80_17150 [Desulfococcaceae bacterium HSG8]|nr:hypothetical protein [Desulfococcaceae bacterium HSG8]
MICLKRNSADTNYLGAVLLKSTVSSRLYYPHIASDAMWWTGIAAYNPSDSFSGLTITGFRSDGLEVSSETVLLGSREKYIGTARSLDFTSDTAWLRIESEQGITGLELFGTADGKQLAGYTCTGISSRDGIFAKTETPNRTGIAFVNTEGSPATVTLTAYDDDGRRIASETIGLLPHERIADMAESIFTQDIRDATYIAYSSDKEVAGFHLNNSSDNMMLDGLPGM